MYFLLVSIFYITSAQLSVKQATQDGFFLHFQTSQLRGDVNWVVHNPREELTDKQIFNGVSSLGKGCSGRVTKKQLRLRPQVEALCKLELGQSYIVQAIDGTGKDAQILRSRFNVQALDGKDSRRRLLNIPSKSPVTSAPTSSPSVVTAIPSRHPVTSAPTSDGQVINPSASPSAIPSQVPTMLPSVSSTSTITQSTTEATIQIMSTSLLSEDNEGSNFAGFDLSTGGGVSLFVFALVLLLAVLGVILGGPWLYRRYYQTFGSKTVEQSPKEAARLSQTKQQPASSFRSESKIEIAPVKSEDRIRLADPVE